MTRSHSSSSIRIAAASAVAALAGVILFSASASADTLPAANCVKDCTATFTTTGTHTIAIPSEVASLTVTVSGAAGAPAPESITLDPTALGGSGGAATVNLGAAYAGKTLTFGVGGTGQGSYVQVGSTLLVVAGGGGGGGYAGYLDDIDQVSGTYPGGNGGAPATAGVTAGTDATAFSFEAQGVAADGKGGTALAGAGGTGDYPASDGGATTTVTGAGSTLAVGGAGGTFTDTVTTITHVGGTGGSGYTGGGGGAIERTIPAGDVPIDLVAPGGGGSGYLAAALTATADPANTGAGVVSFTWSLASLPVTGSTNPLFASELAAFAIIVGAGAAVVASVRRRETTVR